MCAATIVEGVIVEGVISWARDEGVTEEKPGEAERVDSPGQGTPGCDRAGSGAP